MDRLLREHKVIVCAGSGGVGKTTIAAALGIKAAQLGLKVLVLTIDPSKRLGTSLGISDSEGEDTFVPQQNFSGKLYAAILNSKLVFDNFVKEAVSDPNLAEKFIRNRLYVQMSTRLSASQEFTALERLFSSVTSGQYDLVILDTPPAKHAIDFLRAPQKINAMFQKSVTQWLVRTHVKSQTLLGRFSATQQVFNLFKKITGSNFIDELVGFFAGIESWQQRVQERSIDVHKLLTAKETAFMLVSAFEVNKLNEAIVFNKELKKGGYNLSGVIINRAFPIGITTVQKDFGLCCSPENKEALEQLLRYYEKYLKYYSDRLEVYEKFKSSVEKDIDFLQIPEFSQDVNNVEDLVRLSDVAFKN